MWSSAICGHISDEAIPLKTLEAWGKFWNSLGLCPCAHIWIKGQTLVMTVYFAFWFLDWINALDTAFCTFQNASVVWNVSARMWSWLFVTQLLLHLTIPWFYHLKTIAGVYNLLNHFWLLCDTVLTVCPWCVQQSWQSPVVGGTVLIVFQCSVVCICVQCLHVEAVKCT